MFSEQELLDWIDGASYEQLLRRWRFAPAGDPFFNRTLFGGRVAQHYEDTMDGLKAQNLNEAVKLAKD